MIWYRLMSNEHKLVLLTTSVIVSVPTIESNPYQEPLQISERLLKALCEEFQTDSDVTPTRCVDFDWIEEDYVNSGKCANCDEWVTNRDKPNRLHGIPEATVVNDRLLCDQCRERGG